MMRLHGCSRTMALKWWTKQQARYAASIGQRCAALAKSMAQQYKGGAQAPPVIPFTGHHQNEDDPQDAA